MKALVCELCGSNDIIKQDGCFVCQHCGTKYSVEEARKMLFDGPVEVSGTVSIDNTEQIKNYLELSRSAYDAGNGQSACDYASRALELQPQNVEAWIAKMKSIEYLGTYGDLRLKEVAEAGKNAIRFASEERRDEIASEVYDYELLRALSLLRFATDKMNDVTDIFNTYKRFLNLDVYTATTRTLQADSATVQLYDRIAEDALSLIRQIPDEALSNDPALIRLVGECAKQYQYETDALVRRYACYNASLTVDSQKKRAATKQQIELKQKTAETIAAAQEAVAMKLRINVYWAAHAEEKARLEADKASLRTQLDGLELQLQTLPEAAAVRELESRSMALQSEQDALGLFRLKERRVLQEQINDLNEKLFAADRTLEAARAPLDERIAALQGRLAEIETELTRDRS